MNSPHVERSVIRFLVATALAVALWACAQVPVPRNAQGDSELPAVAFEQVGLYRLEIALLVFYGGLLLVTPAFSGLSRGRLPIEISTRGAKFAEEAGQSATLNKQKVEKLEQATEALTDELVTVHLEIERLRQMSEGDSKQPGVDSKR